MQVRLDLDREAPSLLADLSQMHQIVDNLVNNAIEALGEREGTVLIRTGVQHARRGEVAGLEPGSRLEPGDYVCVEVQDTGVGMSAATQRRMFDPFFTTKFTGRGLGLAAVHGIVRAHHGSIVMHSVEVRGASVRVLLAARTGSAGANDADSGIVRGTGTVLVVDDEELVLMTTKMVIESCGYVVHTANGVGAALEALRSTPSIAAVVLDANMPGASGAASVQELRAIRPTLLILICSGAGDAEIEQTFRNLGVAGSCTRRTRCRSWRRSSPSASPRNSRVCASLGAGPERSDRARNQAGDSQRRRRPWPCNVNTSLPGRPPDCRQFTVQ